MSSSVKQHIVPSRTTLLHKYTNKVSRNPQDFVNIRSTRVFGVEGSLLHEYSLGLQKTCSRGTSPKVNEFILPTKCFQAIADINIGAKVKETRLKLWLIEYGYMIFKEY